MFYARSMQSDLGSLPSPEPYVFSYCTIEVNPLQNTCNQFFATLSRNSSKTFTENEKFWLPAFSNSQQCFLAILSYTIPIVSIKLNLSTMLSNSDGSKIWLWSKEFRVI